jgi:hypothetical protein
MKIYYAHCVAIYDTPQETRDVETLRKLGFEVINPNSPECSQGYQMAGMEYFRNFTAPCDGMAFRALPDGSLPAGVAYEIKLFQERGLPVMELPSGLLRRTRSVEETREYLREVGQR